MCRCSRAGPVPGGGLPEGIAEWTATTPDPAYGAPAADLLLSPRVAPQMIGLGLLEAIPVADILAFADPDDANSDGIPGRAKIVPSVQFGVPTIKEQTAAAFAGDIGISTPPHPDP